MLQAGQHKRARYAEEQQLQTLAAPVSALMASGAAASLIATGAVLQAGQQTQANITEAHQRLKVLEAGAKALRGQVTKILDEHKAAVKR